MATVNPPPIPRMPKEWFANPQVKAYQEAINRIIFQLWVNSSSGTIGVEASDSDVSALVSSIYSSLNDGIEGIYSHSISANYTTIDSEFIEATGTCTITLNSFPEDGERVIVWHNAGTGRVSVTDGFGTDILLRSETVISYSYSVDIGNWVRGA